MRHQGHRLRNHGKYANKFKFFKLVCEIAYMSASDDATAAARVCVVFDPRLRTAQCSSVHAIPSAEHPPTPQSRNPAISQTCTHEYAQCSLGFSSNSWGVCGREADKRPHSTRSSLKTKIAGVMTRLDKTMVANAC